VCDSRLGGLSTKVIGSMSVHLAEKMPWSKTYVPPMAMTKKKSICSNPHMSQHLQGNEEEKYQELLDAARLNKNEARVLLKLCPKMTCWKRNKDNIQKATMLDLLDACSADRRFNRMIGLDAALIENNDEDDDEEEEEEEDLLNLDSKKEEKEEEEEDEEEEDNTPTEQEVTLRSQKNKRATVDMGRDILQAKPIVLFGKNPTSTNWGYENATLWVDKGFGAKFSVYLRPNDSTKKKRKSTIVLSGPKRIQTLLQSIAKSGFVSRSSLENMCREVLGIIQNDENNAGEEKIQDENEVERLSRIRKERFAKPPSRKQIRALKVVFESVGVEDGTINIPELLSKSSEDHAVASAFQFHKHTYVTVSHVDLKRLGAAARMIENQPVHPLTWNEFTSHFMQKRSDIEYLLRLYALSRGNILFLTLSLFLFQY